MTGIVLNICIYGSFWELQELRDRLGYGVIKFENQKPVLVIPMNWGEADGEGDEE